MPTATSSNPSQFSDKDLTELLEGTLSEEEEKTLESALEEDVDLRRRLDHLAGGDTLHGTFGLANYLAGDLPPLLTSGTRVGEYEIVSLAAEGGMGVVYQALEPALERRVAIKVPRIERGASSPASRQFHEEVLASANVEHPHILPIYQSGEHDGLPYVAMRWVDGETLATRLRRDGALEPAEVARIGVALADALKMAHEHGLVHRDVKPSNVLIEKSGHIWLTDFGIAQRPEDSTSSGGFQGSPGWAAPEQADEKTETGAEADLFSLGAVLHACLSGENPFEGGTVREVLDRVRDEETPLLPSGKRQGPLASTVHGLLAKNPADRPEISEVLSVCRSLSKEKKRGLGTPLLIFSSALVALLGAGALAWTTHDRGLWRMPAFGATVSFSGEKKWEADEISERKRITGKENAVLLITNEVPIRVTSLLEIKDVTLRRTGSTVGPILLVAGENAVLDLENVIVERISEEEGGPLSMPLIIVRDGGRLIAGGSEFHNRSGQSILGSSGVIRLEDCMIRSRRGLGVSSPGVEEAGEPPEFFCRGCDIEVSQQFLVLHRGKNTGAPSHPEGASVEIQDSVITGNSLLGCGNLRPTELREIFKWKGSGNKYRIGRQLVVGTHSRIGEITGEKWSGFWWGSDADAIFEPRPVTADPE